jgi:hypothetical protein
MDDSRLQEQVEEYAKLAKENKDIDVAALMVSALQHQEESKVSGKAKKWVYFLSISLPPIGILIALFYYFSDESDAKTVANICILLTVVSLAGFLLLGKVFLSSSGTNLQQVEQINVNDIRQLSQ